MRLKNFCIPFQWGPLLYIKREWEKYLREEFDLFANFLLPTDRLAPRHPGVEASYWQELKVQIEPDGHIIGTMDRSRRRIELTKADILVHKFDLRRFRREMCAAFGLIPQSGEIDQWERTVPWGLWEPEKGARFPITLFLGWHGRQFRDRLMEAALNRETAGEIVLTANRHEWTEDVPDIARKHKLLLVPLNEIIQMEDGKFLPTPEWDEYLTAFCKMVEMDLPSRFQKRKSDGYVFAKRGSWIYHFGERETIIDSTFQGASFIHHLLRHPNEEFHVEKLWFEVMAQTTEQAVSMAHVEHSFTGEDTDMPNSLLGGADEMIDAEARREYETRLRELAQERRKAELGRDAAALDAIDKEFEFIQKTLLSSGSKKHRPKRLGDVEVQLYDRIRKAFLATVKHIERNDPEGAAYLRNTIKTGKFMVYSPSCPIEWQFV